MENSFGAFLKQRRIEKNLTQKELAKALFMSESAISKWEKNIAHPDITLLPKLSEILGVTEHELITASIDKQSRDEKVQAKKWRIFSMSWSLFFYVCYGVALIPCFICDLAINKGLTWFWLVLSALLLAFTFTNLPKLIKKHKLILIPLSMYLALCLLLGVCCIYTKGDWFFVAVLSVFLGLTLIFMPIYISKFKVFAPIKKYNDFVSVGVAFVLLNILLCVINLYTLNNSATNYFWYLNIALPIVIGVYLILNLLLLVRFIKVNKLLKTSIILALINLIVYVPPMFLNFENATLQREINDLNILKADFSKWIPELTLENNIHLIIAISLLGLAIMFLIGGLILCCRKDKNKQIFNI